ncbi:MAG TPA: diguanylate cyclase [Candidatus Sulfotelmatobacter sp.]|jgi:GGDEF domain-containing protein|nr:diguanylate cyclase [Candidatus Sulfotelmatobacter sp.]
MVTYDDIPSRAAAAMPAGSVTPDRRDGEQRPEVFRWRHYGARPAPMTTPQDVASLLGMPLGAIPKPLQDKIAELVDEVEHLRGELNQAHHHIHWLEERSDQDAQLSVLHRRAFLRELGRVLEQCERAGGLPGTVALLHVGGIELLRHVHGMEAADAALLHVAGVLRRRLRQTDLLGYLDNGDFAVALTLAGDEGADGKARELADSLTAEPFLWKDQPFLFTVLAGQAHFRDGGTAQTLLAAADAARRGQPA